MPKLIFDPFDRDDNAPASFTISEDEIAVAYGACYTLAASCERDAQTMTAEGRHGLAAALRESAVKYRNVGDKLQGGA